MFRAGDQLVMVGDECLVGLTAEEARNVLDTADGRIGVVIQICPFPLPAECLDQLVP